jgi:hypothetical protein
MNIRYCCFAIIAVVICSCNSNKITHTPSDFPGFQTAINLKEHEVHQLQSIVPDGLTLLNDTLLVIRNATGQSTNHFTLWNTKQKKIVGTLLPAGRKQGQSLGFLSYGMLNNKIWVSDIIKDKILLLNLDTAKADNNPIEHSVPLFYYSVQMLNDSMLVGTGDYDSDYKISLLNLSSGKVAGQMIPYKSGDGSPMTREQKMAYESFLFLKPSGERCVLACRYADQIEIVDLKTASSKIVRGPEGYTPEVMVAMGNDGKKLSTRNEDTRYAFVKGKVTNEFIYLLYSGNNHLSEHLHYGRYLYVYDWEGKPVQKIRFTDDVLDFAIASDNRTIYAYHPQKKSITVSNRFNNETK